MKLDDMQDQKSFLEIVQEIKNENGLIVTLVILLMGHKGYAL